MSYTIALPSFTENSNSILLFAPKNTHWSERINSNPKPQYTTIAFVASIRDLSLQAKKTILKIDTFENLQDNWDSYGAIKPSRISIKNAKQFVRSSYLNGLETYFTAPGRNGDVLVEFRLSDRISSEVYFNSDGTNELLIFGDSECITEGTIEENYHELLKYRNEF